jgi:hypothetical protein
MKALPAAQHSVRADHLATRLASMGKCILYWHREKEWKISVNISTALNCICQFLEFSNIMSASGNLTNWRIFRHYKMANKQTSKLSNRKLSSSG